MSFVKYALGGVLPGMAYDAATKQPAAAPIPPPPLPGPTNTVTDPSAKAAAVPELPKLTETATEKLGTT